MLGWALLALTTMPRPVVGPLAFHLGSEMHMESVKRGYGQAQEDPAAGGSPLARRRLSAVRNLGAGRLQRIRMVPADCRE